MNKVKTGILKQVRIIDGYPHLVEIGDDGSITADLGLTAHGKMRKEEQDRNMPLVGEYDIVERGRHIKVVKEDKEEQSTGIPLVKEEQSTSLTHTHLVDEDKVAERREWARKKKNKELDAKEVDNIVKQHDKDTNNKKLSAQEVDDIMKKHDIEESENNAASIEKLRSLAKDKPIVNKDGANKKLIKTDKVQNQVKKDEQTVENIQKEEIYMADLAQEKAFEDIQKKKDHEENIKNAAKYAEEATKKIDVLSKDLTEKVDKACIGIECITKAQDKNLKELEDKIKVLEDPVYVCEMCGDKTVRPLSSYCPNCGSEIHEWTDDNDKPVPGWKPYWKRMQNVHKDT